MKRCTDEKLGVLLHAYELGPLDSEQQDAFELHLLSCDYCFEQVSQFDKAVSLLRSDSTVQQQVRSAAAERELPESIFARLRELFWPKQNPLLKPALIYLIVLVLAYPAYIGVRNLTEEPVQGVQSLLLTGTRSVGGEKITVGAPLVLMFRINGAKAGSIYHVIVKTVDGRKIYDNNQFDNINDREMATLLLSADALTAGHYTIDVRHPETDRSINEYEFAVE